MPSLPNWTHLCRLCFASLPSLLSLPIFANLFSLLYRSVKREQIVDQVNSLTTRIMRDKKVVENSSVGRDDRAAAAVALFSRRSSEGEREESGAQPTMAFWQAQATQRSPSRYPAEPHQRLPGRRRRVMSVECVRKEGRKERTATGDGCDLASSMQKDEG